MNQSKESKQIGIDKRYQFFLLSGCSLWWCVRDVGADWFNRIVALTCIVIIFCCMYNLMSFIILRCVLNPCCRCLVDIKLSTSSSKSSSGWVDDLYVTVDLICSTICLYVLGILAYSLSYGFFSFVFYPLRCIWNGDYFITWRSLENFISWALNNIIRITQCHCWQLELLGWMLHVQQALLIHHLWNFVSCLSSIFYYLSNNCNTKHWN